jgi:isopentenyl-diphosphate delta-isomerase
MSHTPMNDHDERVILVDENDTPVGLMDKLDAHIQGALHRAFSVLIFNADGDILLQQRAMHKYHSQGLWTNACCSHPRKDEDMDAAIHRRLVEEMNFDCPLVKIDVLHYQTPPLDTGLIENEMLHLYAGQTDLTVFTPEPSEVMAWRWIKPADLFAEIASHPERYSFWFRVYLQRYDLQEMFEKTRF